MTRAHVALTMLLSAVAACLQAPVVVCDDGSVCATGTTCVQIETVTLCATDEHYTACATLAENQACTVGATPGNCKGGVCFPQRCGDGYLDNAAGEVCDGNATSSTGYCTEDCRSTGVCGNEYIDRARGEHCDSGPYGLGRDGCSSHCLQEEANWSAITQPPPLQRVRAAMAYDRARKRMVLFGGGTDQGELDDTWEFDGTDWIYIPTLVAPPARKYHVMAYDEVRQQIVMFGGSAPGTVLLDDTWTWDGATWTNKSTAVHPSARFGAAMAFDAARGEVVLFGGVGLADTWRWNGSEWKEATNATRPPGRGFCQLSDDRERQRLVMFGGSANPNYNDTWEWDGTDWLKRTPATSPPAEIFYPMAYSETAKRTLFVAGIHGTWQWDGTNWSRLPTRTTDLSGSLMQYDPDAASFVLFGGQTSGLAYVDDTYRVSATGAAVLVPRASMPTLRSGHSLDYNPNTGDLYMFGGSSQNGGLDETWRYRHGVWRKLETGNGPGVRRYHASAFDPLRNKLVVFGGVERGTAYGDVWEFDGASETWTNRTPATGPQPTPSFSATMTFDTVRKRVLLSGGNDTSAVLNEVWEWDGANGQWIDRTPPPANNAIRTVGDVVTFDQRRGRAVLVTPSGTWEWDSIAGVWSLKATAAASPPPRINAALAYDPVRATVVLFGGSNNRLIRRDLWEWDGSVWQELFLASSPPTLELTDMAYDAINARLVLFGGNQGAAEIADTWALAYRSTGSPAELCHAATLDSDGDGLMGCADPDCWGVCTPACPPYVSCDMTAPRCGDGVCNTSLETAQLCPSDCH